MWLPALFLVVGILLGFLSNITIPEEYANYLSISVLAAFDTLFGGIRAHLENKFDEKIFISGFFFNVSLAALLAFLGVQLGIDLYLAAVFAFGVRLFQNLSIIRRCFMENLSKHKKLEKFKRK
ncbi:small basic family protein [Aquibacillus sp. 3ASR75-11]|uniref:Small basic family protein n=1 Tax=Terrihalobacillus insolitus TaxID=2950438 RepID=A0A9X4AL12_9BACI|nr:small basic family protein [Terrihalobacillus insolitus]MDC3412838.1 small basic family protein [Terrihalobacillus insolitus]MDC3423686.1 small basic family protein [Terrihalobacillus insolitus]